MGTNRYAEIVELLRREILSGKFADENSFPSGGRLAERFGVSRPTINRVMLDLRHEGLVATHPGRVPRLSRFAQHATGTLGVILPGVQYGDVLSRICESLIRLGDRQGWDIVTIELSEKSPSRRFSELMRVIRRFSEERVAGLFLQPFEYMEKERPSALRLLNELSVCNMPVVLLDHGLLCRDKVAYDLVCMDNLQAGHAIGRSLIRRGLRKIAFLLKPGSPPSALNRMRGLACAVVENGGTWSKRCNVLTCTPDDRMYVAAFAKINHPEAIVCENDSTAVCLHRVLSALGLADEIHLGGFDNQPEAAVLGITSVVQPCEEIASIALQTLLERLRNPSLPVHTVLVPDRGVVR